MFAARRLRWRAQRLGMPRAGALMDEGFPAMPRQRWLIPQFQRLRAALSGPHWRVLVTVPLVLAVLLPIWWMAGRAYERQLLIEQRGRVASDLPAFAYGLTEEFHGRYAGLRGVRKP